MGFLAAVWLIMRTAVLLVDANLIKEACDVADKHLQWILLRPVFSKFTIQAKNVDGKLRWMVNKVHYSVSGSLLENPHRFHAHYYQSF